MGCAELDLPLPAVLDGTACLCCPQTRHIYVNQHFSVAGLLRCSKWTQTCLRDPDCPIVARVSWKQLSSIMPVARCCFLAKAAAQLEADDAALLATLLIQAFLAALPPDLSTADLHNAVRMFSCVGLPPSASTLHKHAIILDTTLPSTVPLIPAPGSARLKSVALFDVSLCITEPPSAASSSFTAGADWTASAVEERQLHTLADQLLALDVGMVASQKLMHPLLQARLQRHGVLALERVSLRHIGALQAVTGAVVLSSWSRPVQTESLGIVRAISVLDLGHGKRGLLVTGCAAGTSLTADVLPDSRGARQVQWQHVVSKRIRPVLTLTLCHLSSHALAEVTLAAKVCERVCE